MLKNAIALITKSKKQCLSGNTSTSSITAFSYNAGSGRKFPDSIVRKKKEKRRILIFNGGEKWEK